MSCLGSDLGVRLCSLSAPWPKENKSCKCMHICLICVICVGCRSFESQSFSAVAGVTVPNAEGLGPRDGIGLQGCPQQRPPRAATTTQGEASWRHLAKFVLKKS